MIFNFVRLFFLYFRFEFNIVIKISYTLYFTINTTKKEKNNIKSSLLIEMKCF